jgi:hypothetical protein
VPVYDHLTRYAGVPVVEFEDDAGQQAPDGAVAWALRTEWEGVEFSVLFERFLQVVDTTAVTHLVFGYWGPGHEVNASVARDLLIEAAPRLPNLTALFFGDIIMEEDEISWITQCDVTPLLRAYPGLERLDVRGGMGLQLSPISSTTLRVLRFESGGLPASVVRALGASDLPRLETLDLWLGTSEYGGNATAADLTGILSGERLPVLTRLGLMDSEIQDEVCAAVATAPVVARLHELDLSMGVLTDDGAEALLSGQPLIHLAELNLRHHYMTKPMIARVRAALSGVPLHIEADRDDEDDEDPDWRYVAVAE